MRKQNIPFVKQDIGKANMPSILIGNSLGPYDSKWPLDSLDKSLNNSQMNCLEQNLLKKHAKYLEVGQHRNIYDVIDSIEWNSLVTEAHLENALHILNDLKCNVKQLVDSEINVLISATGRRCQMLSAVQRNKYTDRLLHIFKMRGVVLGIAARNALLAAQIDNQVDVDVVGTLKQLQLDGLVPDAHTYDQLSRIYARKANVRGIIEIISHMKKKGLKLSDQLLESIVYSLVSSGQDKKAKIFIENTATNMSMINNLKMAYTLAKVEHSDDGNLLELKNSLLSLLEVDAVKQCGSVVYSRILGFLSKEEENIVAAALLLDLIPNIEKRSRLQSLLIRQFTSTIRKKQIVEAVKMCVIFQKCNILKHPLRIYLHDVALNNLKDFHNVFAIYKKTDDFIGLQNRLHLQLPVAVFHFSELMKADTIEKKVEHFAEIVRSLQLTGVASCGDKYFANVKDLFVIPLLKDMDVLLPLMKKFENDYSLQCFVVDTLVTYLLTTGQMEQLQSLLHGALKNSSAGEAYPYQEVKNFVLNTSVYNKSLIPACSLLRLLFPLSGASSNHQYVKGMQVIKAAILNGDLNKVKVMCKLWSADKRIVLRKADKDDILQALDRSGEKSKKLFVTALLEEIMASHNVKKNPVGKAESASRKHMEIELRNAIDCGDLEKAKKIWITWSEHASLDLGLLLAEKLYAAKMSDDFESVLLKLRECHEHLPHYLLNVYDSSDASNTRLVFLTEMSKVLDLHSNVKQQLLYNTKVNAFHRLIEKGDLVQALNLSKMIAAQKNSVFGQLNLMGAAIKSDDTEIISEVLDLIKTYHGRDSALADFCVALLEHCKKDYAERLIQTTGFRLSAAKINYYINREIDLNRVEIILDLFELCIREGNLKQQDLENAVSKIITFYESVRFTIMVRCLVRLGSVCSGKFWFPQYSISVNICSALALHLKVVSSQLPDKVVRDRGRRCGWKVDSTVKDAFNDIIKRSHSFTAAEAQKAMKHFSDFTKTEKVPDYMAVKMASVITTHLGWEEGRKVLEVHYMSHGAELRFAGEASVMDEQVEGAVRRIFDNVREDAYKIARQFYCRLIDLKFCKVKNRVSKVFIEELLKK
uniref:Uncharacterized protein n=1 Tax=Setaria digitata TaxID=48799 RepID=A0A915PYG6_9BILA